MKKAQKQSLFVPGLILAEEFLREEVKLILDSHYTDLTYSAALIGSGSEVLEFDSEISMDHHLGPRVMLFLSPDDFRKKRDSIRKVLGGELTRICMGYATSFSQPNPDNSGVQILQTSNSGPVNHRVEIYTPEDFFHYYININISEELEPCDWLTWPHQKLRSIVAGRVFHDGLGCEEILIRRISQHISYEFGISESMSCDDKINDEIYRFRGLIGD